MKKWIVNRHFLQLAVLLIIDAAVFGGTDPQRVPSFMLIVGFLFFTATIYRILGSLLAIPGLYGISLKHKRRLQRVATGLVAGLTALQSIGQLSSRDVMVLSLLALLLFLYTSYADKLYNRKHEA